jgi:hypothetical protein
MINRLLLAAILAAAISGAAQTGPVTFEPVKQWQAAVSAGDAAGLKKFYSTNPPAKFMGPEGKPAADIAPELDFWQKQISSGLKNIELGTVAERDQDEMHVISLQVTAKLDTPNGPRTRYIMEQQGWQKQGNEYRIVMATHSEVLKMRPALRANPALYNPDADAKAEIKEAVERAAKRNQRVMLMFGGNWCYDCHVLDQEFHEPDVVPLIEKFQVVHVDIGEDGKKNNDLAEQYKVPLDKGVPGLAILGPDGKLLYSQQNGEWESARSLDPEDVIAFLNKWKP